MTIYRTEAKRYASGTKYRVSYKPATKAAYTAACAANVLAALHNVAKVKVQLARQPSVEAERAKAAQAQELIRPAKAPSKAKRVAPKDGLFTWGERVEVVAPRNTLQRQVLGAGREWYKHGKLSTNTRYNVVTAMMDALGDTFTWPEAQAVLKTCDLGSGTPGSYWREFCRLEYIVQADDEPADSEGEE